MSLDVLVLEDVEPEALAEEAAHLRRLAGGPGADVLGEGGELEKLAADGAVHHQVPVVVAHRALVGEELLAQADHVLDVGRRGSGVLPAGALVHLGGEVGVDIIGDRVGGGVDVVADDLLAGDSQLLVGQLKLHLAPTIEGDLRLASGERGGSGRSSRGSELGRDRDRDDRTLLLRALVVAAVNATGQPEGLGQNLECLLGIEKGIVDGQGRVSHGLVPHDDFPSSLRSLFLGTAILDGVAQVFPAVNRGPAAVG